MVSFNLLMDTVTFDLAELSDRYQSLIDLITREGLNNQTNYAVRVLDRGVKTIKDALNFKKEDAVIPVSTWQELYKDYKSMYPPHGGVTEYFIWRDNFEERVAANQRLSAIKEEISRIFCNHI